MPCEGNWAGHITNILQEMPFHLDDIQRKKFNDFLDATYHSKEVKRCVEQNASTSPVDCYPRRGDNKQSNPVA